MASSWVLRTEGFPLAALQHFLYNLWSYADIEGILVQLGSAGEAPLVPSMVEDPRRLLAVNPFLPVLTTNAAGFVAQIARRRPSAHLAAILRPCEARALAEIVRRNPPVLGRSSPALTGFDLDRWLIIGVDCLGNFSAEDFAWRLQKAGTAEQLTSQELRNARQGGISPHRYRLACQMCASLDTPGSGLSIGLLGLPVKEYILVTAESQQLADRLHLSQITDNPAPHDLLAQRERVLTRLGERRLRFQEREILALDPALPEDVDSLLAYLVECAPCQKCLEACPVYTGEWAPGEDGGEPVILTGNVSGAAESWLASCAGCGMCEEACPKHTPLAAIHSRIARGLRDELYRKVVFM